MTSQSSGMTSQSSGMTSSYRIIIVCLVTITTLTSASQCPMEERGCKCGTASDSEKLRWAECTVIPNDSPRNVINAMPRGTTTSILVRAADAAKAIKWDLRRGLLSQFKVLSRLSVPSSGLTAVGGASFVDLKTLSFLDLSGNDLQRIIPGTLAEAKSLRLIDLSRTALRFLDGFLFRDLNLTFLNLSSNFIVDTHDDVFNDSIIKDLDMSRNNLTEIRFKQLNPLKRNLSVLNLSYNRISKLGAKIFQNFRSLKHLNLNHNRILRISDKMFLTTSGQLLDKLETVTIRNNSIRDFPEDFRHVLNQLSLDVDDNPLSCNCRLSWLKNTTCESNSTCSRETKCYHNGIGELIQDVPLEKFMTCTPASITNIDMNEDTITCTVTGDPAPLVWFTTPSGRRIESQTIYGRDVITTVTLNLRSRIGQYSCHAKGYDEKEVVLKSPDFGICPSRHSYFNTGVLIMAIIGTFVSCILVAMTILWWQKCTKVKPRKGRYTAPSVNMAYQIKAEPRPPRRVY